MCEANAFYSPDVHGILFGYFQASRTDPGRNLPGQTVFTCLSHDIIAHETTHAIVDGIRAYFMEPTNIDVAGLPRGVRRSRGLVPPFLAPRDALLDTLQKTGGRLFDPPQARIAASVGAGRRVRRQGDPRSRHRSPPHNPLIGLANQFGEASGMQARCARALGTPPNSNAIETKTEPHDRGSILVAAVFDAYFTVYSRRTSLFRDLPRRRPDNG